MPAFMSDTDVIDRVLSHIKNGTTDRGATVRREPVENYISPDRLEKERQLFRRFPTPICPSAALTKHGDYITYTAAGTPFIIVRGKDGLARGFKNACRHRGTQVASGKGCAGAFVCPYHGWSYGLDGTLLGITHEDGFPDLDKSKLGLKEVEVIETGGLIYVVQEPGLDDPKSLLADLPQFFTKDQDVFAQGEFVVESNWKLFLESFIEGYHIKPAHGKTFYPFGFDNLNVIEMCGAHSRVTYPFRRIEKLADIPPAKRDATGSLTYLYQLFPNVIIAQLTHHSNLGILEPIDETRTRFTTYSMTHSKGQIDKKEALANAQKDQEFVSQTGQTEDIAVVQAAQQSLASGANTHFTFGHFEPAIVHFHEQMDRFL
ncbi:MAG: Rieske 2Fe-2S domain-containing protein [Hellea sp.]|nr:Rieske 2Fe-2S domain-containing protein [Hellea sp.]